MISLSLNANSNSSNIIENLKIEKGFSIEIFLENIDTPRQMAESDAGRIFVGSRSGGTIIAIDKSKNVRIIAKDLSNSTGVTYHNGDLYFSEVNSIWKIGKYFRKQKNFVRVLPKLFPNLFEQFFLPWLKGKLQTELGKMQTELDKLQTEIGK